MSTALSTQFSVSSGRPFALRNETRKKSGTSALSIARVSTGLGDDRATVSKIKSVVTHASRFLERILEEFGKEVGTKIL